MQTANLEQEVIDLSKQKWDWMAARDVEPLAALSFTRLLTPEQRH